MFAWMRHLPQFAFWPSNRRQKRLRLRLLKDKEDLGQELCEMLTHHQDAEKAELEEPTAGPSQQENAPPYYESLNVSQETELIPPLMMSRPKMEESGKSIETPGKTTSGKHTDGIGPPWSRTII